MKTLVYIHDQFIDGKKATISPLDLSVLRGFGVMDYLRTYGGKPFRLKQHLKRFIFSAKEIGLQVPKTLEEMEKIIKELLDIFSVEEAGVKIVLTGGLSEDQLMPEGNSVFFAVAYPFNPFPKTYFEKGIKIVTERCERPFPKAKTTQYLPTIVALKKAEKMGAVDVLLHSEKGFLLEAGTANFFALKDGKIITPKEGFVEGITREVVLELEDVEERAIHLSEIESFEGAFLSSSNKEIMPVTQINETELNDGTVPLKIRNLIERFSSYTKPSPIFL